MDLTEGVAIGVFRFEEGTSVWGKARCSKDFLVFDLTLKKALWTWTLGDVVVVVKGKEREGRGEATWISSACQSAKWPSCALNYSRFLLRFLTSFLDKALRLSHALLNRGQILIEILPSPKSYSYPCLPTFLSDRKYKQISYCFHLFLRCN